MHYLKGRTTRQAHVDIRQGLYEEEYARDGFFGRYAHLYRSEPPVAWSAIEGDLKPRAYQVAAASQPGDYVSKRQNFLQNQDVALQFVKLHQPMPYFFRNADSDDLLFVHAGLTDAAPPVSGV